MLSPKQRCKILDTLKGNRGPRDSNCQVVLDYFYIEADQITVKDIDGGEFHFGKLFDTTSLAVADVLPAGVNNYLTPYSSRWATFRHRDKYINQRKDVRDFMKDVEDEVFWTLNKSNFYDQVTTFYKGTGCLGTSCMLVEEDLEDTVRFYDIPFRQFYLVDDARGRASEFYFLFDYTTYQMVDKFGYENCPKAVQDLYIKNDRDAFKLREVLLYIGPRHIRNPAKGDMMNAPIEASWVDTKTFHPLDESGYRILPAFAHRFYRRAGSPYGYSPAMKAMSDVRWANVMGRTEMQGSQMNALPAIAMPHNAWLRPFNLNPLKQNYYNPSVISGKDDVFPLAWGNVQINEMMLEKKIDAIKEHMFYNVFLAFRGITKQMTIPEVMQKAREEMSILGPAVGRFESDFLDNVIHVVVDKEFRTGKFDDRVPDIMRQNPEYEIEYTSLLSRTQKNTEFQSLQSSISTVGEWSQIMPTVLDNIDGDRLVGSVWELNNTDPTILKDKDQVAEERQIRQEQEAEQMDMIREQSEMNNAKTASEADRNMAETNAQ